MDLTHHLPLIIASLAGLVAGALLALGLGKTQQRRVAQQQQTAIDTLRAELHQESQQQITRLREQVLVLETVLRGKDEQLAKDEKQQQAKDQALIQLQHQLSAQGAKLASANTELEYQKESAAEKIKMLEQTRQQLSQDFELLANRIFDEKTDRFDKSNKTALDTVLTPLREQLKDFKQKVEDVYDKDSRERISLAAELGQLKQLNQQMSVDALNLTNALKGDNKAQGNWGEVILERVLEESGLHKGREYDTQVSLKTEQGERRNPDVVIRLPERKDIIVDSKVSLVHYERYCNSVDEIERQQALKAHVSSVRNHITNLSIKDYEQLEGIRTLDFVFIFIPIESAFMAAFEHDQSMFKQAYEKNIIVVGPTTLLATLRTVQSIWRYERQNKNAEEIARQAGAMHDKFVGFINDLDRVSESLLKAGQAHQSAMNKLIDGKGNLVGSARRLEKLGAKVKKTLPASVDDHSSFSVDDEISDADLNANESFITAR
ncbi:MAG: DNA recombination protein RmuC [Spongiibacteraceae bacterium]